MKNIKYVYPEITEIIRFSPGYVSTLVIENQSFFREIAQDFYLQIDGFEGRGVISDDDDMLDMRKYVEMINQYIPFEINKKPLMNRLYAALEKIALDSEHYLETQQLLASIEKIISEWGLCLDIELDYSNLSVSSIIKSASIRFAEEAKDTLEKILDYMEIVREFDRDKIFVFVQLRSYFSDDDVRVFLKTALNKDFTVFLIDSAVYPCFDFEKRIVIDTDLCLI